MRVGRTHGWSVKHEGDDIGHMVPCFAWGDTQVHVNERHPVGRNAIRLSAFGVY